MSKKERKFRINHLRINRLRGIILEMIQGKLFYEAAITPKIDELAALSTLLNMLNEELRDFVQQDAFQNINSPFLAVARGTLILNLQGEICNVSSQIPFLLEYADFSQFSHQIEDLLLPETLTLYQEALQTLEKNPLETIVFPFQFHTKNRLILNLSGSLQWIMGLDNTPVILITLIDIVRKDSVPMPRHPLTFSPYIYISAEDRKKIEAAVLYLKENIEDHMVSLTELARHVRTNEFKLKRYFKQLYNTTAYEYQKELRLRRAVLYLTDTNLSMKEIAKKLGYKTAPHFTKVFKEHYHMPPSTYRKEKRPPQK